MVALRSVTIFFSNLPRLFMCRGGIRLSEKETRDSANDGT